MTDKQRAQYQRLKESGHFARSGRKGGLMTKKRHGRAHFAEAGLKGGEYVKATHGLEYYREIRLKKKEAHA